MRRKTTFVAISTLGLAIAATGCGATDGDAGTAAAAASVAPARPTAQVDAAAPDFTLSSIDGDEYRLAASNGRVRLIDFWATWCAPCREEIPLLNELEQTYGERGFQVVAISDEDPERIRDFVRDNDVVYTNLIGTEELLGVYGVLGLPVAYLVDEKGTIVESFFGPKPRRILVEKIEALLGAPAAS